MPDRIGRYVVERELSRSDTGVVYQARDPELHRQVSIKVVPARFLGEARALARLTHPAVVPVFDVGTLDDGVYVVMPHVRGVVLSEWLEASHPWREVLRRFLIAGRGLAATHAAGIIHFGFDPRRVLVAESGEVMLADVGLADEGVVDVRADVYSFCTSLAAAMRDAAPPWLAEALKRGSDPEPVRRWPSMGELLDHIERRMRRPRQIAAVAGIVTVLGLTAGAALVLGATDRTDACPDPRGRLAGVWTAQTRSSIEAAFRATKLPYVDETLAHVVPALDGYADSWRKRQIAACRAARGERKESQRVFDQRTACLDRRLAALRGRAETFVAADAGVVENAVESVDDLPALDDCDDTKALLAYGTPIAPPLRARLAALEERLDEIDVLELRAVPERLKKTPALVDEARALGYPPVLARALAAHASALGANNQSSEATLREEVRVAAEARDDRRVVEGWDALVSDLAIRQARLAEAKALEPVLTAAFVRAGSPASLVYRVESTRALLATESGELEEAIGHQEKVIAAANTPATRADARANMAVILENMGRYTEAIPMAEQALRETEETFGPNHPETTRRLQALALTILNGGDVSRSEPLLMRALAIQERAFGPDDERVASTVTTLGNLARTTGKYADAERWLTRAVTILEKTDNRNDYAMAQTSLADAIYRARGFDEAKPHYERAMAEIEHTAGRDSMNFAMAESNYGVRLQRAGDCAAARPYFEHALAYMTKIGHAGVSMATASIAQCDDTDGKLDQAIAGYEQALAGCRANGCPPGAFEAIAFSLARAFVEHGRNKARGIALMREARAGYEKLGNAEQVTVIDGWLKRHGAASH